jgi:hypothetical protein
MALRGAQGDNGLGETGSRGVRDSGQAYGHAQGGVCRNADHEEIFRGAKVDIGRGRGSRGPRVVCRNAALTKTIFREGEVAIGRGLGSRSPRVGTRRRLACRVPTESGGAWTKRGNWM